MTPDAAPPFDLTDEILDLVREIGIVLGRLSSDLPPERHILLRRANKIRTVHASCAVEGNTLTAEQVEALLEGRRVRGPAMEIREVKNALEAYYAALRESDSAKRSTPFIRFMLMAIRDSLDELAREADTAATPQVTPQVKRLLAACEGEFSRAELQERLGLADRKHFRASYLLPALDAGLIEMTIPDKPRSSAQRYRLTSAGKQARKEGSKNE